MNHYSMMHYLDSSPLDEHMCVAWHQITHDKYVQGGKLNCLPLKVSNLNYLNLFIYFLIFFLLKHMP